MGRAPGLPPATRPWDTSLGGAGLGWASLGDLGVILGGGRLGRGLVPFGAWCLVETATGGHEEFGVGVRTFFVIAGMGDL